MEVLLTANSYRSIFPRFLYYSLSVVIYQYRLKQNSTFELTRIPRLIRISSPSFLS